MQLLRNEADQKWLARQRPADCSNTDVSRIHEFALKTKNCALKTRNFIPTMMNFAGAYSRAGGDDPRSRFPDVSKSHEFCIKNEEF